LHPRPDSGRGDACVPTWIASPVDLERFAARLGGAAELALDTEGDSLHHYPERLSLLQLAGGGEVALVDPLAIADLRALAAVFADKRILTIMHAGDNDLAQLKRRYSFTFAAVFDTSLAARFVGARALGLDVLLRDYLGVELPPSRQKDDWSARPLSEAQIRYAAADVQYLVPLKDRLTEELTRVGRLAWVEEESGALAARAPVERPANPDAYLGLKGARTLPPRHLAALRELYETRERLARSADRPPFKILSEETLVRLALASPDDMVSLVAIPGCTPRVTARWGEAILAAIARARALPESELPSIEPRPRPRLSAETRRRIERLRRWRAGAAPRFGLEPWILLPNRLITAIAEAAPRDREELLAMEGVRRWRVETFGDEIASVVASD